MNQRKSTASLFVTLALLALTLSGCTTSNPGDHNPAGENEGSQTTAPPSKPLTEVPSIIPVTGPFAPCTTYYASYHESCPNIGVLTESLSWSVRSDQSNDIITLVGSIQGISTESESSDSGVSWNILDTYAVNTEGEQIGEGSYGPYNSNIGATDGYTTLNYLRYGQLGFFYTEVKVGLGEAQFLSHFEFEVNAGNGTYEYYYGHEEPDGLSYAVSSAEVWTGDRSAVVINWANDGTRSVSGDVFIVAYDAENRAQGIGKAKTTIPAAGSVQVTVTTDTYIQNVEPAYYSVYFQE